MSATDHAAQAARLACLHAEAFDRPWNAQAFSDLLDQPGVFAAEAPDGFILMRAVGDEAEILTLAVRPTARRHGLGARLVGEGVAGASVLGVDRVFLEVAEDNAAARSLYRRVGFVETGRRPRYYVRNDGTMQDALLLALNLTARLP
ncbi:GNAT family N-acetyltransferase [Brevundimonas lenta]|uniref:Ribosomal-protein-alanine N-acetyltransferase n=1 Tax=Brevundimonas lenta TaxID=424796 RepID=A0A7W6JC54_9CAUL|nr:GNAT family N-acetyltransferase [Brevundimonas lenta]MBB4081466.1 ribosomal-protein-alanine N-acetyltransferase [Brevundimonas lenta]